MSKPVLAVGGLAILLVALGLVLVPILTAPKMETEAEILAAVMKDVPEVIPESQLAVMNLVRFKMPGFD